MVTEDHANANVPPSIRCLWVEDELKELHAFRDELRSPRPDGFGWAVETARTTEVAHRRLRHRRYQALILDLMAPDGAAQRRARLVNVSSGLQLLHDLLHREVTGPDGLPLDPASLGVVIVWTAVIAEETRPKVEALLRNGADAHGWYIAYLAKPVDADQFDEVFRPLRSLLPAVDQ